MTNPLFNTLFTPHLGKDTTLIYRPDGRTISHHEFLVLSAQLAHCLVEAGLQPGDRIAVQVPKSPEALALYAATVHAGVIFLPLNTAYTIDELDYFIQDSGASLVICAPERETSLQPIAATHQAKLLTLDGTGKGSLMEKAITKPTQFEVIARELDDLAALLYTSGTTGRSKGAMLTQRNLLSNAKALMGEWRFTADDVLLHALPIFHTHGLFVACNVTLLAGGSMIFLPSFDLDEIIRLLPKATTMMGVPTFYTRMLDDPRFTRELTEKMRLFISGSAPLLAKSHQRFTERTGHFIIERYGMTETSMNTSNPYDGERRPGSVGFPLPGVEIRITNPKDGKPVVRGEKGQIEIRGENVFKGYWNMPEKTREEFREDGFFISGDLGLFDEDGYLTIVGRDKDLIISGGYNIYPKEIELALNQQPGVDESAVIGIPHADFGETVLGIIKAKTGANPDLEAIMASVAKTLARFKHPRKLVVVDEIPRNSMGKIQKNILREQFKNTLVDK